MQIETCWDTRTLDVNDRVDVGHFLLGWLVETLYLMGICNDLSINCLYLDVRSLDICGYLYT